MDKIEVKVLNPEVFEDAERMMVAMARLTQRGAKISCMDDLVELLNKEYKDDTARVMAALPHPTIQKFSRLNIAIVGASRRFLAQITRHQDEVKFMSGSLQYSDYTGLAQFTVPYEVMDADANKPMLDAYGEPIKGWHRQQYLNSCAQSFDDYQKAVQYIGHDAAGYMMPQGLRNVLLISAVPFEWKHMISQRGCRRNTLETQYVVLRCWEEIMKHDRARALFQDCYPPCASPYLGCRCPEGKFSCGHPVVAGSPSDILDTDFPLLREGMDASAD